MTKVLKLLGGGWLAAVLGIVLIAAVSLFSNDSGTTSATSNFDRASAHVTGADLAPASLANNTTSIRYLPGDITATSRVANAAGQSNPLTALPVSLTRAADALAGSPSPYYGPQTPGGVSAAADAKGMINYDSLFVSNMLARYMKLNTINVSRVPASDLGKNVDFLNDSGASSHTNNYTLNSRWNLVTWVGAGNVSGSLVKNTDVSGKNLDARTSAIVTGIYAYDDTANRLTQVFPATVNVFDATTKVTLSANQAYWIATTNDLNVRGLPIENIGWAVTDDLYARAIERARGNNVQFYDPFIPAVVAGGGLVLDNGTLNTNTFGAVTCTGVCDSLVGDIAAATRTGVGMTSIIKEWNVLEDANFSGSMAVFDGDVAGSGQYFGVHAMDPVVTLDFGTTVGSDTITATAYYPKASTSLVNAIESWKNYQLLTMNSINDGIAQLLGVGSDSRVSAGDGIISGISESNGTGVSSGSTHEAWYQAIATTALSNSAFLVLGIVALFAATFVAMWTSDGFGTTNHRAVRAPGAG